MMMKLSVLLLLLVLQTTASPLDIRRNMERENGYFMNLVDVNGRPEMQPHHPFLTDQSSFVYADGRPEMQQHRPFLTDQSSPFMSTNEDVINQQVYNVRYITNENKTIRYPPEIMRRTSISNYECRSVVKTDSLSKTYQVEHRWDNSFSIKEGVEITFTGSIPFIVSESIRFSIEVSFQYSWGKTVTEAITSTDSVQITAPPNSYCVVNMEQHKVTVNIPFTASLKRTYTNGEIRTTSITGTYDSVQVEEVRAVADRCHLLDDAEPCTLNAKSPV